MTRIVYKIIGNMGERRRFDSDGGTTADIELIPHCEGYIVIGGEVAPMLAGHATIDLSSLADGEYTPLLYGDDVITLESVRKERGKILPTPTSEAMLRSLLLRTERLEEEVKRLSLKLGEIGARLGKEVIF